MEETKNLTKKTKVVASVNMNPDTGEINDVFYEGDSYTKHTKEHKEKKAKFLQEENEYVVFNKGVSFVKLYDGILDELSNVLSDADFKFCMRLAKHVSYKDCILRTNGNPNGKILDMNDIAKLLNMKPSTVRGRVSNLIKYGVLGRHVTGCKGNPELKIKTITCNPYIFFRGSKISPTIQAMFENSMWN